RLLRRRKPSLLTIAGRPGRGQSRLNRLPRPATDKHTSACAMPCRPCLCCRGVAVPGGRGEVRPEVRKTLTKAATGGGSQRQPVPKPSFSPPAARRVLLLRGQKRRARAATNGRTREGREGPTHRPSRHEDNAPPARRWRSEKNVPPLLSRLARA